jgi:hypothetical protein
MKAKDIRNLLLKLYARDHVTHSHLHDRHNCTSLTINRSLDFVKRLSEPRVQNGLSCTPSLTAARRDTIPSPKIRNWIPTLTRDDGHIQIFSAFKGRFTHSMPCPCRSPAMPCRYGFRMSFPFDLHSAAVSDSHLPRHAHTAPMSCSDHAVLLKATSHPERRETACGLPARVRLLPATTSSSTKIVIRSIPILLTTIHTYDCKEW